MRYEVKLTTQAIEQIQEIAVYFQNPVRTGNCAKMVGFFAVRNQKAGFHAIPLSSYSGRTVAHKRNSQNAL